MNDIKSFLRQPDILQRTVYYCDSVDLAGNKKVVEQIAGLVAKDPAKEIVLYITSGGGDPFVGFALYDLIKVYETNLITVATGKCQSAALYPLLAARPDRRYATAHTKFLLHSSTINYKDFVADIRDFEIGTSNSKLAQGMSREIFLKETKLTSEQFDAVQKDEANIGVEEAIKMGLVSAVI